jgi:oxidase EvaA
METNTQIEFIRSALSKGGECFAEGDVMGWFRERQQAHRFRLEQIPFADLVKWGFDPETGNLRHESGRFFSIEGIRVQTNWGLKPEWEQPIINQPEIGFLGFITKKIDGVLHFLVQAKMEPGNINMIQLAPTLQATRSNFTRVHQGKSPPYLEYFTDRSRSRVLMDALQSEQGARFLRKRNRNIIIEVKDDIPVYDDYRWMTLGQLLATMRFDNIVNMDARTVLSGIPYEVDRIASDAELSAAGRRILQSFERDSSTCHSNEEIISWFTEQKFRYDLDVERMPLKEVRHWERTTDEIRHESGRFFSVIACAVEADSREVFSWTQPLVKAHQQGLIAFVVKEFGGVLHFLVQAKVEPGNFDVVEMAPTVQCITGSYEEARPENRPPFVNDVLNAPSEHVWFDSLQSEEGGRFYREENRNLIVEAWDGFPENIPDNYIWMTARQLKEFIKYNNFVNVQARCLLASLSFT